MRTINFIQAVRKSKFLDRKLSTIQTWEYHFAISNALDSFNIPYNYDPYDSFIIDDDYVDDFFSIVKIVIERYLGIKYNEEDMDELLDFFSELQK